MRAEARCALTLARGNATRPIRSALDVGCATGDHAAHLQRAGVRDSNGLDLDRALLERARRKHPRVRFRSGDMVKAPLGRRFDAVFAFYGVVAYVRTPARLALFAKNVARHLEPGGVAVIEPWHLAGKYVATSTARHVVDAEIAIARASVSTVSRRQVRLEIQYLVARGGRIRHFSELHRLGLFSRSEHLDAFRAAGLETRWSRESPCGRGALVAVKPD